MVSGAKLPPTANLAPTEGARQELRALARITWETPVVATNKGTNQFVDVTGTLTKIGAMPRQLGSISVVMVAVRKSE